MNRSSLRRTTTLLAAAPLALLLGSQGTMVLKIDDKGCLDGGMMMGKLCKL
jgi:hypothetical protein